MRFGDFIRDKRIASGWTQPEAASKIGIEQSYLSKLENGRSIPSSEVYAKICRAYAIDAQDIHSSVGEDALAELIDIEEVRAALAVRRRAAASAKAYWRFAGVAAFGVGGLLMGASQVGPTEETRFVYQSSLDASIDAAALPFVTAESETGQPMPDPGEAPDVPSFGDEAQARSLLFSQDYLGPAYVQAVPEGNRVWRLVGGDTQTKHAWMRWLLAPGLGLIFIGIAGLMVAWREPKAGVSIK